MITSRNPMKDAVAFAAAATTGFVARNTERSSLSYVAEACVRALRSCGLGARDIDGICGSDPHPRIVQAALGIPEVTWHAHTGRSLTVVPLISAAANAVFAGQCETVLVYHSAYRSPWNTSTAVRDPFRRGDRLGAIPAIETIVDGSGYCAWASRYLHEHQVGRDGFARIAVNNRTNARDNPAAAMRTPMTMAQYFDARLVKEPLGLFDMDIGVDGADAFVVTSSERARDLPLPPVHVHAIAQGMTDHNEEDQSIDLAHHGQQITVRALRAKSDFWIEDCDLYMGYDGFTAITINWIEDSGWCGPGEGTDYLTEQWVDADQRLLLGGRVPLNTHGGSLSEGATQGSGHIREAVHQLQGLAGARQVAGARRAVLTLGGFFRNAQGLTLCRAEA